MIDSSAHFIHIYTQPHHKSEVLKSKRPRCQLSDSISGLLRENLSKFVGSVELVGKLQANKHYDSYGESHCRSVGCIVDGCPPGMELTEADIQPQMTRRRPGQSALTTPRDEKDQVEIHSGTEFGVTLGTPIGMLVRNQDQRPKDYGNSTMDLYPRPSHADWTYLEKYGVKASSGGGRSSARETIGRVAAGAIAEKYLKLAHGIEITAFVTSVGNVHMFPPTAEHPSPSTNPGFLQLLQNIDRPTVDSYIPVRCPDGPAATLMKAEIEKFRDAHDSIGGTVTCVIKNVPSGLGEPAFDKMEAMLAHAMLSIPATKGFEIGSGFGGCEIPGSIHNDPFIRASDEPAAETGAAKAGISRPKLTTKTNNSGGIQGGITNGAPIYFRVAFKPPATIGQAQQTVTYDGDEDGVLEAKGRHDPCVVPRAVPIVEAMAALVVIDALMAQQARQAARSLLPPLKQTLPPRKTTVGGEEALQKIAINNQPVPGSKEA
jgi:chorismate synthase